MADPDPLDDRLAALSAGPVPPLPGPAQARAHGDRRRRRQQLALGCAAVVAAATLGGGVALLTGGNGSDALRTADAPTASPSAAPSPAPTPDESCPVPSPGEVASGPYCSTLTIEPDPSAPPSSPTPDAPAEPWAAAAALLSPDQASRAELPGWFVEEDHPPRQGPGPVVDPCSTGTFPGRPLDTAEQVMSSVRETGGSGLVQRVTRLADEPAAAAAFDELVTAFTRCPEAPAEQGESGDTLRYEVVDRGGSNGVRSALVRVQPCGTGGCLDSYRSYLVLVQAGDGVSEAFYGLGEDGDPGRYAAAMLDAVAQQLARAVLG